MEGKLNELGELVIKRANGWTELICPFSEGGDIPCGDWCPHFTEPFIQKNMKYGETRVETVVHLCHGKHWKFADFEDRRELK